MDDMQANANPIPAIPFPDYGEHPAYRTLQPMRGFEGDEDEIAAISAEVDASLRQRPEDGTADWFAGEILSKARRLDRMLEQGAHALLQKGLRTCLDATFTSLASGLQHHAPSASSEEDRRFREQGFATASVSMSRLDAIRRAAEPYMAELISRAKARPEIRLSYELPRASQVSVLAQQLLRESGLWQLAEHNRGEPCVLRFMTLHHAHPRQSWYKNCYQDVGLPTSTWSYLHYDKDATTLKAMIYLHEVDESAGPFGILGGSGGWRRNEFQYALANHTAGLMRQLCGGVAGSYYRTGFECEQGRRWWLSLPKVMRVASHFGDDLWDERAASTALQPHLRMFTGTDAVLFDGGRCLHVGGLAREKPRWAIHFGLGPVRETATTHSGSAAHAPKLARRVLDALRPWLRRWRA